MSKEVATASVAKERLKVYKAMTPALQEIAKDLETKVGDQTSSYVLFFHRIGTQLKTVVEDEATYGSKAVDQLAAYMGYSNNTKLYGIMQFAEVIDRETVKTKAAVPMSNGQLMSLQHWINLSRVHEDKKRDKLIERVLKESLSALDIEAEVRATSAGKNARSGGRKPVVSSNPVVGLQKIYKLDNTLARFAEVTGGIFDQLDEMTAELVNDNMIEKAKQAHAAVLEANGATADMADRLEATIKNLEERLEEKREAEKEAKKVDPDEYDEDEKPAKKGKKSSVISAMKKAEEDEESDDAEDEDDAPEKTEKKKKKLKKPAAVS